MILQKILKEEQKKSMSFNAIGITVVPKEGERCYLNFCLDNEDRAYLNAPDTMDAFEGVTKTSQLLKVLDNFFINEGERRDEDGNWNSVEFHLADLVGFYDYDKVYPKFKKKVNALKTLDKIACITVFTDNDVWPNREYRWAKFDFEKNELKSGTDYSKDVDFRGINFEPSEWEMLKILAEK